MFGVDLVIGFVSGCVTAAALGLMPACRKFALGFLFLVVLTQLYLEGIAGYQQWVGETIADLAQHQRFAASAIVGAIAGVFLTFVSRPRARGSP